MAIFIYFVCLCPLGLTIKLNFNLLKAAYSSIANSLCLSIRWFFSFKNTYITTKYNFNNDDCWLQNMVFMLRSSFFVLISTLRFSFKIKLLYNFFKYMYSVNVSLSFVFHISHLQFTLQPLKIAQGTNYFPKTIIFMQLNQAFFPLIPVSLFHCLTCPENPEMDTQSKYKLHPTQ